MPAVPDVPGVPSAEELSALPAGELAARLAEAYRIIGELTAQVGRLSAQVDDLRRRAGKDSSTSSRPPSSDSPYTKRASANSTLSATSSTATHGSHPAWNPPDNAATTLIAACQ